MCVILQHNTGATQSINSTASEESNRKFCLLSIATRRCPARFFSSTKTGFNCMCKLHKNTKDIGRSLFQPSTRGSMQLVIKYRTVSTSERHATVAMEPFDGKL